MLLKVYTIILYYYKNCMGRSRGGVSGVVTPPNSQSHSIKYSTTDVLGHADALICIAKCLVVVVVRF